MAKKTKKKARLAESRLKRRQKMRMASFDEQFSPIFARISKIPSKTQVEASLSLLGPRDPLLGPPRFFLGTSSELPRNFLGTSSELLGTSSVLLGPPRFSSVLPGPPLSPLVTCWCFLRRRASENASDGLMFGHFHVFASFAPKLCHVWFF